MNELRRYPGWGDLRPALVGMLHLQALPGSPGYRGDLPALRERLFSDAEALSEGGAHAMIMENFGDAPFYPGRVPPEVVAHMATLALQVHERFDLPLGINCLRNDSLAALAVAHAAGAQFIRVNVLIGARVADQGLIQGEAHLLLRERARLQARQIRIYADVDVKHSVPLGERGALREEIADLVHRGGADAIIVSGQATGGATEPQQVREARRAAGEVPVLVGSGCQVDTLERYSGQADGFIVGSALKHNGQVGQAVDIRRVRQMAARVRTLAPATAGSRSRQS